MAGSEQDGTSRTPAEPAPTPRLEVSPVTVTGDDDPPPDPPRWSRGARLLAAAAVLVLGLGAVAVLVILSDPHRLGRVFSGDAPGAVATAPAVPDGVSGLGGAARAAQESPEEIESAPLDGRRRATFELVDGVTRFDLRVVELGEELYRVASPAGSGVRARPELAGDTVLLRLDRAGTEPGAVEVQLNARVSWNLLLTGGSTERRLDLTAAQLSGLELAGGATRTDLRLPQVSGTFVVRVTGGVNRFDTTVSGGLPVRVRSAAGAGDVTVYDRRSDGVPPGTVLSSPDWDRSADRIFLDLVAGANIVTVRGQ